MLIAIFIAKVRFIACLYEKRISKLQKALIEGEIFIKHSFFTEAIIDFPHKA